MFSDHEKEFQRLEKIINQASKINTDDMSFNDELAMIRIIEEVGGIAKKFDRAGYDIKSIGEQWRMAIRTRDKISHSYESLTIEPLISALKEIITMKKDLPRIKKLIS